MDLFESPSPRLRLPMATQSTGAVMPWSSRADQFAHLARRHPCIGEEASTRSGRIHLPVSPACNIQCRFCRRGFHKSDQRPGVARRLLSPVDAVATVQRALASCPELRVVGVAGPGDSLATAHALEALRAVATRFPHLTTCLSTNGLRLAELAEDLASIPISVVTVTVNAVAPDILAKIVSSVRLQGRVLRAGAAADALTSAQAVGIQRAAALGAFVKVNTVVIPGVNLHHVGEVARTCAGWGAQSINLIPLIPQHEFAHHRPPSCVELGRARELAQVFLPVFRHCRHCRADACGVPGREPDLSGARQAMTFSHG